MTLSSDGVFEEFLDENNTVWRRVEGRNDVAVIDAFMGMLGLELGRIRFKKKLKVNQWAPQLASAEASLNRKPMATLRGNAPPQKKTKTTWIRRSRAPTQRRRL